MVLQADLELHLIQDLEKNRENGYTLKTMTTEHGITFELNTPRDKNGIIVKEESDIYVRWDIEEDTLLV